MSGLPAAVVPLPYAFLYPPAPMLLPQSYAKNSATIAAAVIATDLVTDGSNLELLTNHPFSRIIKEPLP